MQFGKNWLNSFSVPVPVAHILRVYPCVSSQILTCVTLDEFVMFGRSNHSGKSSHDIIQLLHLLWVASLQHWKREGRELSGQWIQTNITQKHERKIHPLRHFFTLIVCGFQCNRGEVLSFISLDFPHAALSTSPPEKRRYMNLWINTLYTRKYDYYYLLSQ